MTQCERVLRHMKDYGSITSAEAITEYGIYRLASRISDLKRKGIAIKKETVSGKNRYGESTSFARYSLRSEIDMPYTIKKNNDGTYTAYIAKREKVFPDILKAAAWCSEIRGEA